MEKKFTTQFITRVALMSVISYVLIILYTTLPIFPDFLKLDISDVPPLITAMTMGPVAGIIVQFIKNLLNFITNSNSGGVGEIANFFVGLALILPLSFVYRKNQSKNVYIIASIGSILFMSVTAMIMNYYLLLPFYAMLYGVDLDHFVAIGTAINSNIVDMKTFLLLSIMPFNILKGTLTASIGYVLIKYLTPVLRLSKEE